MLNIKAFLTSKLALFVLYLIGRPKTSKTASVLNLNETNKVCQSVCMSVYLSICLSINLFIYLFIKKDIYYLSIYKKKKKLFIY